MSGFQSTVLSAKQLLSITELADERAREGHQSVTLDQVPADIVTNALRALQFNVEGNVVSWNVTAI